MNRNGIFTKIVSFLLIAVMLSTPMLSLAQESDYLRGKMDGEAAAKGSPLWFLAGVACGIFGVGAAYFIKPNPPAHALIGKSSEYVLGYTEGYQNKARNANVGYACAGWIAWVITYAALGGFQTSTTE